MPALLNTDMEKRGLGLVLATALISGVSIFINKFGVAGIDSSVFAFAKNVIVAVFIVSLIGLLGEFRQLKQLTKKQWIKLAVIGLVGGSVPFLMFFRGLQLANAATAAFIHKIMFVFVAVMAFVFLKEKLKKNYLVAAVLILLGNGLLLGFVWQGIGAGEMLILGATLFWAVEQVISKHALKELSSKVVAFGRMFFGSVFILAYLLFTGKLALLTSLSVSQLGWIMVTSVFLLGYVLTWYSGLKHVDVSVATCVLLLGSVITTLLSFVFLDKLLTIWQVAGMLMLIAGVVLAVGYSNIIHLTPWSKWTAQN